MKRMSRVIALLLCSVLLSLSLCGCFQSRQLNERALVQAIGIDRDEEKEQFLLTFQIYAPAAQGGGLTASPQNATILQAHGSTVSEAMQNATLSQGKELFIGHSRILVLGSAVAKRGIELPLTFFATNASARHNVDLVVSETTAADILTAKINQGILPAETLEKILENSKENGMLENVKLFEFLASLHNKHDAAVLPMLRLVSKPKEEKGNEKAASANANDGAVSDKIEPISEIEATGMAIFTDAKMTGQLDGAQAQGLLWLRNKLEQTTLVVQTEDYSVAALKVYQSKSELIPQYNGDNVSFTLKVKCQATMGEGILRDGKAADESSVKRLQTACEQLIKQECMEAFEIAVKNEKADIFNLGNIVWKDNSALFKTMRDSWPEQLSRMELTVKPEILINRLGLKISAQ